jgi:perosamine synthetase
MTAIVRHQLPAYSPLTVSGLLTGLRDTWAESPDRLRSLLGERYKARRVVLTGSGTQALTLAIRSSAPTGRAPLVALPAYSCYDLVSAAVGAGARMVFYDVDPASLGPDASSLAEVCALKPDAVVIAPLYGIPVDWEAARGTVAAIGALLVEDAAQGLGAGWKGQAVGSLGDVSILSFGRGKGWTGGGGGALLERRVETAAPDPTAAPRPDLDVAGKAAAQWLLGRPTLYWLPAQLPWLGLGETEYRPPREPEPIPALAAALVLAHDQDAQRECDIRKKNAEELLARLELGGALEHLSAVRPPEGAEPGYLRLPLLTPSGMAGFPDQEAARAAGIMPGYPRSLPELRAAKASSLSGPPTPGAERLARTLITLPTHRLLSRRDKRRIREVMEGYRVE